MPGLPYFLCQRLLYCFVGDAVGNGVGDACKLAARRKDENRWRRRMDMQERAAAAGLQVDLMLAGRLRSVAAELPLSPVC